MSVVYFSLSCDKGTYPFIFMAFFLFVAFLNRTCNWSCQQGLLNLLPAWPASRGSISFPTGHRGWQSGCSPPSQLCLLPHGPVPLLRVPSSPPTCVSSENITCGLKCYSSNEPPSQFLNRETWVLFTIFLFFFFFHIEYLFIGRLSVRIHYISNCRFGIALGKVS